jgi:hypothetical protein
MSGLNVENFNLFAKKSPAKPVQAPAPIVEEVIRPTEMAKEEITIVKEMNTSAGQTEIMVNQIPVEIERFDDIRPTTTRQYHEVETRVVPEKTQETNKIRKFETFATPTFRIPQEHDLELKRIEQTIMRNRRRGQVIEGRERITSNTVVRALLANFIERVGDMDLTHIDNEEMLKERMEKVFKQKYSKRN